MSCSPGTNVPLGKDKCPGPERGALLLVAWTRIGAGWGRREVEERPTGGPDSRRSGGAGGAGATQAGAAMTPDP